MKPPRKQTRRPKMNRTGQVNRGQMYQQRKMQKGQYRKKLRRRTTR